VFTRPIIGHYLSAQLADIISSAQICSSVNIKTQITEFLIKINTCFSINLSTKIQDVGYLPTGDARQVAPCCYLEPLTSPVLFKRSYYFNTSSSNKLLKTFTYSKFFDQYNFNTRNYY